MSAISLMSEPTWISEIPWLLYLTASVVVIIAPGQDMVLVMSRGLSQGTRAGLATGAGISTGLLVHSAVAAIGLGAILTASATAYAIMKYVGAAYLLYLGLRLLLSRESRLETARTANAPLGRLFLEGALSNMSNPKIVLFYFAFLPQFVPADAPNHSALVFLLGVVFAALTFAIKAPVGYFAGALSGWFRRHPHALTLVFRASGLTLIGLGLRLAFDERK